MTINKNITFSEFDYRMMDCALEEAKLAASAGDVPVGAVLCYGGKIIAKARNSREVLQDATAHAEILALSRASQALRTWHLEDCVLYVTLEPCAMCAGAIINARVEKVIYGASQAKTGAVESVTRLFDLPWTHQTKYCGGLKAEESVNLLRDFFRNKREERALSGGPGQRRAAAEERWLERLKAKHELDESKFPEI